MSCILSNGVTRDCGYAFGGLSELFLGNYADVTSIDYDINENITGVTLTSGAKIYQFEFIKNTAQFLQELQGTTSKFINQTLNFQLNGINLVKSKTLETLGLATVFAIVKKADGNFYFAGEIDYSNGLECTVSTIDTGTAEADPSFAQLTLVGASRRYARTIDASVVLTLQS